MRQNVTVVSVSGRCATVAYDRPTACSGDCKSCGGSCTAMQEHILVTAENRIGAAPGDRVTIESETKSVFSAIFLVYALPIVLFFALYFGFEAFGIGGTVPGILGFFLGLGIAAAVSRRSAKKGREITYQIISYAGNAPDV